MARYRNLHETTYTVREPGCSAWTEGLRTLGAARREQEAARNAGLSRAGIVEEGPSGSLWMIDEDDPMGPADEEDWFGNAG